jgi:hypothetical protein
MDLKFLHDFLNFIADKEMGGMIPHDEIDMALHVTSIQLFNDYKKVYDLSQDAKDALSPFMRKKQYTSSAKWEVPQDCGFILSAIPQFYNNALGKNVYGVNRLITETEFASRMNSQVRPVSATKPICVQEWGEEKQAVVWYPAGEYSGTIFYLKYPTKPKYVFTVNETTRKETYIEGKSTTFEWSEADINRIIYRAAPILGLTIDDNALIQYSMQRKMENA